MTIANLYLIWMLIVNVVTFGFYGYDKMQSKRDGWRVSEQTLHLFALSGGFLGGWLGMYGFRHKTLHVSFKAVLVLSTLLHIGLIIWWLA